MIECQCQEPHEHRRIVLTGGPGAGKTAVLELVRQYFCKHVDVLPEAASILFGGGFRRGTTIAGRAASQRAIFHVQRELETTADVEGDAAIILCDRGTIDGFAYWPGPEDFWSSLGTTREREFQRYSAVIHLRTPLAVGGYNHRNPVRIESAAEAALVDERLAQAWEGHPRRFVVESTADFLDKAKRTIEVLRGEMPECCRQHLVPTVDG
ncbi:MAG: ATP-binding protein [Myxococcales bacterium]|nr:ATP-binding protein [Myxococcales bacterium]